MSEMIFEPIVTAIKNELGLGKTQVALAEELNVPQQTLSAIVRGESKIGAKTLQAILSARPEWIHLLSTAESSIGEPV